MDSKHPIKDSRVKISWPTRELSIRLDQLSLEVMEKKLFYVLIQHFMNNGAQHSERHIWNQMIERSQMLSKSCPLLNVNLIILLERETEWAQSQVVSKLTHNFLTKLHGKLKQIIILILSELNIEIDIIKLSHSTNQH
jgi:hypothetical protein